ATNAQGRSANEAIATLTSSHMRCRLPSGLSPHSPLATLWNSSLSINMHLRAPCTCHRQWPKFASPDILDGCGYGAEHRLHLASEHVSQCRCLAPIRNVDHVDAGHHLEQFARQMACRSVAT